MELIDQPFAKLGDGFIWLLQPVFASLQRTGFTEAYVRAMARLGVFKIIAEPDKRINGRATCLWQEAKRRGIEMFEVRPLGRPVEWFFAKWQGRLRTFDGLPRPLGRMSKAMTWMDNKAVMKKKFIAAGIPVARGGSAFTLRRALDLFHEIQAQGGNAIVKPGVGSRSRHTFIHLTTDAELTRAFLSAKQLCPWVMIEEELRGMVHRATLIGKKCVATMRREPAFVTGDGISTVKHLVMVENKKPGRQGPVFHEIPFDTEAESELARQKLTWESVPHTQQTVILGLKVGRGGGGSTTDTTPVTHPENIALFEKIAETLDDPLVGIDVIIEDISRPWHEQQPCGVIECNSCPFIDLHHFPLVGEVQNAAGALWDIIFPVQSPAPTNQ